jgi:glyoxylase-like metal-dependent hydrolase (beta-lactamase superfamily II)
VACVASVTMIDGVLRRGLVCALACGAVLLRVVVGDAALADGSGPRRIFAINDHLLAFYDGRDPSGRRERPEWNWVDDAAMGLGIATYAIHKGNRAIVYDTFTSVEQARWVRDHLQKLGIRHFSVILSHWHMDHVAGNAVYRDSDIIASDVGREILVRLKDKIEAGEIFGPPGIAPLILPNLAYHDRMDLYLHDLKVELHNLNIHTADGTVVLIPSDRILLAGDTLEDSVTYMVEVADLPEHVRNLRQLKGLSFDRIYPNHGDPEVIRTGGYRKTLIDATVDYITAMVRRAKDADYLDSPLEAFIGTAVTNGWVSLYEPYREVHRQNQKAVHEYYKNKPLPRMD